MSRQWKNFGDVDFLHEGGSMVRKAWNDEDIRKHPSLGSMYEVLQYARVPAEGDKMMCAMKLVDIDDYRDDKDAMTSFFGSLPDDPMLYAAYCAEYTGIEPGVDRAYRQRGMYAVTPEYFLTTEDALAWLVELRVPGYETDL